MYINYGVFPLDIIILNGYIFTECMTLQLFVEKVKLLYRDKFTCKSHFYETK